MKILKIFGIVVGIHVFVLVMIFSNPGCSSSSKPTPAPGDTVAKAEPAPNLTVPSSAPALAVAPNPPVAFNPDAPAAAAPTSVRFTPTRPNTPAASALVTEPVQDVTPMTTYTVKSGDSLWSIANKNKLSYQELAAANNLKSNAALKPGQKLVIPGKSASRPSVAVAGATTESASVKSAEAPAQKPTSGGLRHTVRSGETLGTIAQKYGIKQRDLAVANNITDPLKLPAGKELIIPGWDAKNGNAAGKSATKTPAAVAPANTPSADGRPIFTAPQLGQPAPVIMAQPPAAAGGEVPVIRVDESPSSKKP